MSDELFDEIERDLKNDFPNIENIENTPEGIKVSADDNTLWEVFEVLYNGVENIEFNMGKDEDSHILIKL